MMKHSQCSYIRDGKLVLVQKEDTLVADKNGTRFTRLGSLYIVVVIAEQQTGNNMAEN